jgi:hypothetical protein
MGTRVTAVVLLLTLAAGACKESPKTVAEVADEVLHTLPRSDLPKVASGATDELYSAFRANRSTFDDAFRVTTFATAARQADQAARVGEEQLAQRLTEYAQQKVVSKLRQMACEAKLSAPAAHADPRYFQLWVAGQFASINVQQSPQGQGLESRWLADKINDPKTPYKLACLVWVRSTQ